MKVSGNFWIAISLACCGGCFAPVNAAVREDTQCGSAQLGLIGYWGQNSAGAVHRNNEKSLLTYCQTNIYDQINIGFLYEFPIDARNSPDSSGFQPPALNLANHCVTVDSKYPNLLTCPQISSDIQACQKLGKKIVLSMGGGAGTYGFQSDSEAVQFAKTFWNMFLGGSDRSFPRPFGPDVVLDGVDLDIEAGNSTGYSQFIISLRKWMDSDPSRDYLISVAPQCAFPDKYLNTAIQNAPIDRILVQFYNNYCCVDSDKHFNMALWIELAKSAPRQPKVYMGVPGDRKAAHTGYVDFQKLTEITDRVFRQHGKDNFGGIMVWEVSQADFNHVTRQTSFAQAAADMLHGLPCLPTENYIDCSRPFECSESWIACLWKRIQYSRKCHAK